MSSVCIDSFSGAAADLPKGHRTEADVLAALRRDPRVSCWDRGEHRWLDNAIRSLELAGAIQEQGAAYPWYRYAITEKAAPSSPATSTSETR